MQQHSQSNSSSHRKQKQQSARNQHLLKKQHKHHSSAVSNTGKKKEDDSLIIGVFGDDDDEIDEQRTDQQQLQLLPDDTSVQHQNGNNLELGQSIDMDTESHNLRGGESDNADNHLNINESLDHIASLGDQNLFKKRRGEGTQSLLTLPTVPTNAQSTNTLQSMSTLSAAAVGRTSSVAKDASVEEAYAAALSSNLSTSVNPTPKHPLAYHWRNQQNGQKKQRQLQKYQYMTGSYVVAEARRSISTNEFPNLPQQQNSGSERSISLKPRAPPSKPSYHLRHHAHNRSIEQTPTTTMSGRLMIPPQSRFLNRKQSGRSGNFSQINLKPPQLNQSAENSTDGAGAAVSSNIILSANRRIPTSLNARSALDRHHRKNLHSMKQENSGSPIQIDENYNDDRRRAGVNSSLIATSGKKRVQPVSLTKDGRFIRDPGVNKKIKLKLKYTVPEKEEDQVKEGADDDLNKLNSKQVQLLSSNNKNDYYQERPKESGAAEKEEVEVGAYKWPSNMYISSRLVLSQKNIEATEEYLEKAKVFHHLWQPEDEIKDIQKAILMHQNAKEQQKKLQEAKDLSESKSTLKKGGNRESSNERVPSVQSIAEQDGEEEGSTLHASMSVQYAEAVKDVVDNYALLKQLRRKSKLNNELEIKKKLKQVDQRKELEKYQQIKGQKRVKIAQKDVYSWDKGGFTPFLVIKKELGTDFKKDKKEQQKMLQLGEATAAYEQQSQDKEDETPVVQVSEPDMKAVLQKIKEHELEMQQHKSNLFVHKSKDPDAELEAKMLAERKAQLQQSIANLQTFIYGAERQDSNQRKFQLFGGDVEKEKEFYAKLKLTKEKFNRVMYNITKQKEKQLFHNKLNKLVTLVRKADKQDAVDQLVHEIDRELIENIDKVRDKLRFVRRDNNPGLTEDLKKIYEEIALKESLDASRPLIRRHMNLLKHSDELNEMGLTPELLRKISVGDAGKRVFEKNRKLLDNLMKLEQGLISFEKSEAKAQKLYPEAVPKFERTCQCHKQKNQKASEKAKHFLYHQPNPKIKWQVQSKKLEEKKDLIRRKTIIERISPFKSGHQLSERPSSLQNLEKSLQQSHMSSEMGSEKDINDWRSPGKHSAALFKDIQEDEEDHYSEDGDGGTPNQLVVPAVTDQKQEEPPLLTLIKPVDPSSPLKLPNKKKRVFGRFDSVQPVIGGGNFSPQMRSEEKRQQPEAQSPPAIINKPRLNFEAGFSDPEMQEKAGGEVESLENRQIEKFLLNVAQGSSPTRAMNKSKSVAKPSFGKRRGTQLLQMHDRNQLSSISSLQEVSRTLEARRNLENKYDDLESEDDLLNQQADGEFDDLDLEVVDLLQRVGLDADFQMINYDSDADSDLLTVTAKPKDQKQEKAVALNKQNHRNNRAAEKYEKMMKEKQRREKELRAKQQITRLYNKSQLYESTQKGTSIASRGALGRAMLYEAQSQSNSMTEKQMQEELAKRQKKENEEMMNRHQSQIEELLENCNELMLKPVEVDQEAIQAQEKANQGKIAAIDRLMDEISIQYDPTDIIYLKDIERILNDNKVNDAQNFVTKFDLNFMNGKNAAWIVRSHKRTQKQLMSTMTKHEHLRFIRRIDRDFNINEMTSGPK